VQILQLKNKEINYKMKKWDDYSAEDILLISKSYFYFFKCYLQKKGFVSENGLLVYKKDKNIRFEIQVHLGSLLINFYVKKEKSVEQIWLHRYVLYPSILDTNVFVHIPYPDWGYGYIEQMVHTLEETLLNDLINRNEKYDSILKEHLKNYHDFLSKSQSSPIAGNLIQDEERKMLKYSFEPTYLSLEIYKNRKNPFRSKYQVNIKKEGGKQWNN